MHDVPEQVNRLEEYPVDTVNWHDRNNANSLTFCSAHWNLITKDQNFGKWTCFCPSKNWHFKFKKRPGMAHFIKVNASWRLIWRRQKRNVTQRRSNQIKLIRIKVNYNDVNRLAKWTTYICGCGGPPTHTHFWT